MPRSRAHAGRYFWQAELIGPEAELAADPVGELEIFDVVLPRSSRRRGKLYPRFGRRGRTGFYLSGAGLPAAVEPARFASLAGTSARRWGLKPLGWTSARAGRRDGFNIVGFSSRVPAGKLGGQIDYRVRGRVVERDIILARGVRWHAGPGSPPLDSVDLETVLIHELGHMAGNKGHRAPCANSPLTAGLVAGEWWHGPRDQFLRRACAPTPR